MKLTKGLRVALALLLMVSFGIALTLVAGIPEAELTDLATNELIPEVRIAAGMALSSYWRSSKTIAELETIATTSNSDGLRTAAGEALAGLYLAADKTYDELVAIACGGATAEVRKAAISALVKNLIEVQVKLDAEGNEVPWKAEDAKELALNGECSELRSAGAEAYFHLARALYREPQALVAVLDGTSEAFGAEANDEIKTVAARVLAGAWKGYGLKTEAEVEAIVLDINEDPFIREAAGRTLYIFWTEDSKSVDELWLMAVENTSISRLAAYRNAIILALAYVYRDC